MKEERLLRKNKNNMLDDENKENAQREMMVLKNIG